MKRSSQAGNSPLPKQFLVSSQDLEKSRDSPTGSQSSNYSSDTSFFSRLEKWRASCPESGTPGSQPQNTTSLDPVTSSPEEPTFEESRDNFMKALDTFIKIAGVSQVSETIIGLGTYRNVKTKWRTF